MTELKSNNIIKEIRSIYETLTKYSENAQLDSFLNYYDNSSAFLHCSSDGNMRNYEEFKKICTEYYTSLEHQTISTIIEKFNVVDTSLVILGWMGNIMAKFKNGDAMNMNNYCISIVFKKIDGKWKIIHSHESALPSEVIKKQ